MKNLNFGQALEALKNGKHLQRRGWNGKGMFIFMTGSRIVKKDAILTASLRKADKKRSELENQQEPSSRGINAHIDMMAADGTVVVGWLASQTDMLSNDWQVLE